MRKGEEGCSYVERLYTQPREESCDQESREDIVHSVPCEPKCQADKEHAQVHLVTRSIDLRVTSRQAMTIGKSTISAIIMTALRADLSHHLGIAKRL
jgi:hypothetical protein